jgi:hypothetical protein
LPNPVVHRADLLRDAGEPVLRVIAGLWGGAASRIAAGTVGAFAAGMTAAALSTQLPLSDRFAAEYLEYFGILPIAVVDDRLHVAVAGSPCPEVLSDLATAFEAQVEVEPVERDLLEDGIRRAYAQPEAHHHDRAVER